MFQFNENLDLMKIEIYITGSIYREMRFYIYVFMV